MSATTAKKKTHKPRKDGALPEWSEVVDRLKDGRKLHAGHLAVIRGCTREHIIDLKCEENLSDCDIKDSAKSLWWSAPLVLEMFPEMRAVIGGGEAVQ